MKLGQIGFKYSKINKSYELVRWINDSKTCYVIAFFRKGSEGYDMETVSDRFFEDHDAWVVGKHALAFLNEVFEAEEEE